MSTFNEQLSALNLNTACKLLGPEGNALLMAGGNYNIDPALHVELKSKVLKVDVNGNTVTICPDPTDPGRLVLSCSECNTHPCVHKGAVLSLILEEKQDLGLAEPAPDQIPIESLSDEALIDQAIQERKDRAKKRADGYKKYEPL